MILSLSDRKMKLPTETRQPGDQDDSDITVAAGFFAGTLWLLLVRVPPNELRHLSCHSLQAIEQ
jgi:hypothetical protein